MKNFLKATLLPLVALGSALGFSSCGNDDDPFKIAGPFYDFATVKSYNTSTITLDAYVPNSNDDVALSADFLNIVKPEEYPAGTRVMMTYNTNSQLNDGLPSETTKVQLISLNKALTLVPVETEAGECTTGDFNGRLSIAPYRTGGYINFLFYGQDLGPRAQYTALLDKASLATDTPHIYVNATEGEGESSADNCYPVSVDIASLWNNHSYKAITIHIKSLNYEAQQFTIKKQ